MALKKSPNSKKESQNADLKEVWGQKKPEGAGGGTQQEVRMLPLQIPVESGRDSERKTMFNPDNHLCTSQCCRVWECRHVSVH